MVAVNDAEQFQLGVRRMSKAQLGISGELGSVATKSHRQVPVKPTTITVLGPAPRVGTITCPFVTQRKRDALAPGCLSDRPEGGALASTVFRRKTSGGGPSLLQPSDCRRTFVGPADKSFGCNTACTKIYLTLLLYQSVPIPPSRDSKSEKYACKSVVDVT